MSTLFKSRASWYLQSTPNSTKQKLTSGLQTLRNSLLPFSNFRERHSNSNCPLQRIFNGGGKFWIPTVHCVKQSRQTSTYVLSNCGSLFALDRFKTRHDSILAILVGWIIRSLKPDRSAYVDLEGIQYKPLCELFQSIRPDQARSQEFFVGGGHGRATIFRGGGGVVDAIFKFEGG